MADTNIKTGVVRASFVHVFSPWGDGDDAKYSLLALVKKDDKRTIKAINEAIEAAKELGKDKCWGGKIPKNLRTPLRDGDEEKDTEEYPEYEGCYFMNTSSKRKPGVVNRQKERLEYEEEFKSGDYCKLSLNFYPYSFNGNNGISAGLNNVLFWEEGEALGGGRVSAENDFADEFDEDDDDDLM